MVTTVTMVTTITTNHSVRKCMSEIPPGYGNYRNYDNYGDYGNYEPLCSEVYVGDSSRLR